MDLFVSKMIPLGWPWLSLWKFIEVVGFCTGCIGVGLDVERRCKDSQVGAFGAALFGAGRISILCCCFVFVVARRLEHSRGYQGCENDVFGKGVLPIFLGVMALRFHEEHRLSSR